MLQFIAHTGRSTRIVAAVLIQLLSEDITSIIVDLDSLPMNDPSYYEGHRVIFVGGHPPIRKMDVFNKAVQLVYIGNDTHKGEGKVNPLFKVHSNVRIIATEAATAISCVLDYLKELYPSCASYNRPILEYLCHRVPDIKSIHYVALALAAHKLTELDVHLLLDYNDVQVEQLRVAGRYLDIRHNDLITRFLEKETRMLNINGIELYCCGSNSVHTSYMATELSKLHGIGAAYYDTAEFRHYELRTTKEHLVDKPELKKCLYNIKDTLGGIGSIYSLRFRAKRNTPLASL